MLSDQTLRAIQPLKCSGIKCGNPMMPVNSLMPAIQEIDMSLTDMRSAPMGQMFDGFSFKETNNKIGNLRGNE